MFWVAGSPTVGFGHLRRSWTLALELRRQGAAVQFVAATREAAHVLRSSGLPVAAATRRDPWSGVWSAIRASHAPVCCVVDDPDCPAQHLAEARRHAPVACVDDTGLRAMPVDLVVNGSAGAERLRYRGGLRHTRYLLGPHYILLRREFARAPRRVTRPKLSRVFVSIGGGAQRHALRELIGAARAVAPEAAIDVVVGPFGSALSRRDPRIAYHRDPSGIRRLMVRADVALSAGGQTTYELAATGTPTLGIRVAENQRLNLRGLSAAGALRDVGAPEEPGFRRRVERALRELARRPEARERMSRRGRQTVDGRGAERVAQELIRRLRHDG